MALNVQWITPDFATAPQLGPGDIAEAAQSGFRSVINNRPDFEGGPVQPTSEAIAEAANDAGLAYAFLPVAPNAHSPDEIGKMRELIDRLPKPVLAFCRSGTRAGNLFRAAAALPRK
jgi:uncharacterized protein (TIGR01244 family)